MVESVSNPSDQARQSWYRGPISAVLVLDPATVIAACGRTLMVFKIDTEGTHSLILKQESCLPPSLKICAIERVDKDRRFTVRSDRTFAIYDLVESPAGAQIDLIYNHGAKAIDQITRVRVAADGTVALLLAHNFTETFNIMTPDNITRTICEEE